MEPTIDYRKLNPDRKSGEPLHLQLHHSLVREIRSLPPNRHVALISERELAQQLKLSRRTTHRAYEQLIADRLVRRMPDKSLVVRSDARTRITGAYPVIGVLIAIGVAELMEKNDRGILPYLEGLIGRCSERDISCVMLRAPAPGASPEKVEEFAAAHFNRLCGLIHLGGLCANSPGDPVLEQILNHTEIPQVCISGSVPFSHVGSIYADPMPGLNELCRTLKERGYRSAGVIGKDSGEELFRNVAADRPTAMKESLKRNGIECRQVLVSQQDKLKETVHGFLTASERPEVLLCHDDRIARMVMEQAASLGISIPGDLALAGYNSKQDDPFLASIRTFPQKIAEAAVDLVMDQFENGITEKNSTKIIKTAFSDGKSIAGPEDGK